MKLYILTIQFDVTVSFTERILCYAFVGSKVLGSNVPNLQHHVPVVSVVGRHRFVFIACNRMVIAWANKTMLNGFNLI